MTLDDDDQSYTSEDSTSSDICEVAVINEHEQVKMMKMESPFMKELERVLIEVYEAIQPKPIHYQQRNMLVEVFNKMSTKVFGKNEGFPIVEEFGSFKMDLFTSESDLDLSVNFSNDILPKYPREEKIEAMKKLSKALNKHQQEGHVRGVLPVLTARVPVLKLIDCGTNCEIDISVENKDGIFRSSFILLISSIDKRFKILSYLMKMWAKANKINCSRDRTISSMAIIAFVCFHLQTRNPPILPPFVDLFEDGMNITIIEKRIQKFKNFGSKNKESIAQLFVSLLCKLKSVEDLWQDGLCASTYEGSWIIKKWGPDSKYSAAMAVEDFYDRSENFARSVGKRKEIKRIYQCTQNTLQCLSKFLNGKINQNRLKSYIFGPNFGKKIPVPVINVCDDKILTWDDIPVPEKSNNNNSNKNGNNNKRKLGFEDDRENIVQRRYEANPSFSHLSSPNPSFSHLYSERNRNPGFSHMNSPNPSLSHLYSERNRNPSFSHLHQPKNPSFSYLHHQNPSFSHLNPSNSHLYREPEPNPSFSDSGFEPNPSFSYNGFEPNPSFSHNRFPPNTNPSFSYNGFEPNPSFSYNRFEPNPSFSQKNYSYGRQSFRK